MPSINRGETVHLRNDACLLAEVRLLNGTDSAILDDEEILRIALPVIRGDYEAIETYSCVPGRILNCPITALTGDADPKTPVAEADEWRLVTVLHPPDLNGSGGGRGMVRSVKIGIAFIPSLNRVTQHAVRADLR